MNLIIMPVVAGLNMTRDCVASLLDQDVETSVLAIDNGSTDGCGQLLRSLASARVMIMSNVRREGLNATWNKWIRWAFAQEHDHVLVVNNDTVLRHDTYRLLRDDGGLFVTAVGTSGPVLRAPSWRHAEHHVKLSHFTRQGLEITGVVHVGTNDGYEIEHYLGLGASRVIGFEPLASAANLARERYAHDPVWIFGHGLSDRAETLTLNIAAGDGQGSSFLPETSGPEPVAHLSCKVVRFDSLTLSLAGINTLVVDVQGMEMQVLRGFGERLKEFTFLNVECSRKPLYHGEYAAQEVVDYLVSQGFEQDSPIEDHNDVMFVRKGARLRDAMRPHPDFSCFLIRRECWERVGQFDERINAYCGDGDYHLRMHRAGVHAYCLPIPFTHIASGTAKAASPELVVELAREADEDRATFKQKWGFTVGSEEYYACFGKG